MPPQLEIIIILLLGGVATGIYLDIWQIVRVKADLGKIGGALGDLAIWVLFVLGYFNFLYQYLQGSFSFSFLLLTIMGAGLYYAGGRRWLRPILQKVLEGLGWILAGVFKLLKLLVGWPLKIIFWPLSWLGKGLFYPSRKLGRTILKKFKA